MLHQVGPESARCSASERIAGLRRQQRQKYRNRRKPMSPAEVLQMMNEKGVKFVGLRPADARGREQHVTVPASKVDESFFEDGKVCDGSSLAGWKGIDESDMILL